MKIKHLLLYLFLVGCAVLTNAQKKPYNNLIITEARFNLTPDNYVEFTNMGNETIDLSEFEVGGIVPWTAPWRPDGNRHFKLPKKMLEPGKSFLIATGYEYGAEKWIKDPTHNSERTTKPEFFKLADMILHQGEGGPSELDSVTPYGATLDSWNYNNCIFLRHHFIRDIDGQKDSMVIDQVGGVFSSGGNSSWGASFSVGGASEATFKCVLVRRNIIKEGITEFSSNDANNEAAKVQFNNNRGVGLDDSEWIPVPFLGGNEPWRAVFWTAGNQVNAKLDANTLISKTGKVTVDFDQSTITVPWGVRGEDSIMYQFQRKPGLAWHYYLAGTSIDSTYASARTGDKLTLYVCGDKLETKDFTVIVREPTSSDNIVIPKKYFDYNRMAVGTTVWNDIRVSDGIKSMDTISRIDFGTRADSLFKYLEKAPKASWKIVPKSGIDQPELVNGDLLRVTSENGKVKDYYLKLKNFMPSDNSLLSSITWPDMPESFKGDIAKLYGWKGDTIPAFSGSNKSYLIRIPDGYDGIPSLSYSRQQLGSKVAVTRAKTLDGSVADRTITFTVTAENNTNVSVYTVQFEKSKDPENIQPYTADAFISRIIWFDNSSFVELYNPGTETADMSNYMITCGYGGPDLFNGWNATTDWANSYRKYVPGRKWQSEADWAVQPRILEPDLSTSSITDPGDVFLMSMQNMTQNSDWNFMKVYGEEVDVNLATGLNPWGFEMQWGSAIFDWFGATYYLYKIENDSVRNGLKPATDIRDFKLIDTFGSGPAMSDWVVGGVGPNNPTSYVRKPTVYKGNPEILGSFGTDPDNTEWLVTNRGFYANLGFGWPDVMIQIGSGLGSHVMYDPSFYKSTISSLSYKVSPGYTNKETIRGVVSGTTVSSFLAKIIKANELQTLTVKSAANGAEIPEANMVSNGDTLVVLSADSINTSKYILDVNDSGLPSNAVLTSAVYTIKVDGATGTISGFAPETLLKNIYDGVVVPAGATMTMIDENDAYMTLTKLNYDTTYVNVIATDKIYFEVIAENGVTKILYQLTPTSNLSDAYVTSDVYSVDQTASLIEFIPNGTTVPSLIANIYPAPGANVKVYDKAGFVRDLGNIYRDDKLQVTAADGKTTKTYFFSMLNSNVNTYLAYVTSSTYKVDQIALTIKLSTSSVNVTEFYSKLEPSFGATILLIDKDGNPSNKSEVAPGDKLKVIAADNTTSAIYTVETSVGVDIPFVETIKMYPNPTSDKVIINGLSKGNRVRVFNSAGISLRDVTVNNSTEYVSLAAQPAGIYVFVISSDEKFISIQKIVKK